MGMGWRALFMKRDEAWRCRPAREGGWEAEGRDDDGGLSGHVTMGRYLCLRSQREVAVQPRLPTR